MVLDARPVRKGETRLEIVEDLLDSAEDPVHVDNVLMDREFDSQHVLEMISQRGLSYVVPKRMQISERARPSGCFDMIRIGTRPIANSISATTSGTPTTLIYRRKENPSTMIIGSIQCS